jgi:hypothetical protein
MILISTILIIFILKIYLIIVDKYEDFILNSAYEKIERCLKSDSKMPIYSFGVKIKDNKLCFNRKCRKLDYNCVVVDKYIYCH